MVWRNFAKGWRGCANSEPSFACLTILLCWLRRLAAPVRWVRRWLAFQVVLRSQARTARDGRWPSSTACKATCWHPKENRRRKRATGRGWGRHGTFRFAGVGKKIVAVRRQNGHGGFGRTL